MLCLFAFLSCITVLFIYGGNKDYYYYILSFKVIGLLVLEKKIFKIFTINGHGGHLGHVTHLICKNFHSYSPSSFHFNFGSKSLNLFLRETSFNIEI